MRFSQKRTCVEFLEKDLTPDQFKIMWENSDKDERQSAAAQVCHLFNSMREGYFNKRVQFISKPLFDAVDNNKEKIQKALATEVIGELSGTMMWNLKDQVTKTVFYYINQKAEKDFIIRYIEFTRMKDGIYTACGAAVAMVNHFEPDTSFFPDGSLYLGDGYYRADVNDATAILFEFILIAGFLKYCDVETKILKPKEKHREFNVKYYNETKSNIEVIDSRWFMNIIREHGFTVRGHFRLQPYPTLNTKKWKYINQYEKTGYNAKAKKLSHGTG